MIETVPDKLNEFRIKDGPFGTTPEMGVVGAFLFPSRVFSMPFGKVRCIVDDGRGTKEGEHRTGWEHVSATELYGEKTETPSWRVMSKLKDLFWKPSERVVQYHPPEEEYVNCHENVLHLWRPVDEKMPFPPASLVGPQSNTLTP